MSASTITYGIDLGTTNSCIAHLRGRDVDIVRNNEGGECTPSAVWLDRQGRLHVGRRAREQFEADEANACLEFKLLMGKPVGKTFQRTGREYRPEELSAEVLKSLLADVRQRGGEEPRAAVITVPADFDLPQCDATRRAAELAGLTSSPLLQEPVAAALAYGAARPDEDACWLVYDLGGGTFDAAVIQMRDGLFRVINHGGDRCLGGKLIDWAIVEQLLIPALLRERPLPDFRRGNPRWRAALAKLKMDAEQAKIQLSRADAVEVNREFLCQDDAGDAVEFHYELKRADVERLMEPLVLRTINICKRVLSEKGLAAEDVARVILVGGPTLTPYLRQRLQDAREGVGIPLDVSQDPLTVVARGAALFAGSQRLEASAPASAGQFTLQLEYQPVGVDLEPLVVGKVIPPAGQDLADFTVEFVSADRQPPWRSGRIRVEADGLFETQLAADEAGANTFLIELRDAAGRKCDTVPDRLSYTLGVAAEGQPLIHSLGIAMADNQMQIVVSKGAALPARKQVVHRTALVIRRGASGDRIRIPVVEGENLRRADRNRLIGALEIRGDRLQRDIPALSEIEITVEVDSSRLVRAWAYVALLDEEFGDIMKFDQTAPDPDLLRQEVGREKRRLGKLRDKAHDLGDARAAAILERIEREEIVQDLEVSLGAAGGDADAAEKCQNRLLDLRTAVDELENLLEWPALQTTAADRLAGLTALVEQDGTADDKARAELFQREAEAAVRAEDADLLWRQIHGMEGWSADILWRRPTHLRRVLRHLEGMQADFLDHGMAKQLLTRANRADADGDLAGLRAALNQLIGLLPMEKRGHLPGHGGTTIL